MEVLLALWLATVGTLILTPASQAIRPWGAVFLTPIAATALSTLAGLVLVTFRFYNLPLLIAITSVLALSIAAVSVTHRMVTWEWFLRTLGGALALAGVVAVVAWQVPMVRFTSDSYHYLMSALALVRSGTLEGVIDEYLLKRQLATPLLHTIGVYTGRAYVSFWTPLLGVATFGTMMWLADTGLRLMSVPRRWRWGLIVPALAFTLTTNRVAYHFFYINGHMLFAGLLLSGVGLAWLATRTGSWTLLWPASLMFGALIPLRAESGIVVGAFLLVFVSSSRVPVRWRWVLVAPAAAATLLWDVLVLPRLVSEPSIELLKSPLGEVVVMAALIILLAVASTARLPRFVHAAPWIAIGLLTMVLGALVLRTPQIMIDTIDGMSTAMTITGFWGTFWMVVPFLAVGAAIVGFRGDRYILFGLFMFPLIIPILAYLRGSRFHEGEGDSANRMIMHIVPLLVLAVVLGAGSAVRAMLDDGGDESQRPSEGNRDRVEDPTSGALA